MDTLNKDHVDNLITKIDRMLAAQAYRERSGSNQSIRELAAAQQLLAAEVKKLKAAGFGVVKTESVKNNLFNA